MLRVKGQYLLVAFYIFVLALQTLQTVKQTEEITFFIIIYDDDESGESGCKFIYLFVLALQMLQLEKKKRKEKR